LLELIQILFVCTIVRGIVPKRHKGMESLTVFVLITDNRFDFYNITKIADDGIIIE